MVMVTGLLSSRHGFFFLKWQPTKPNHGQLTVMYCVFVPAKGPQKIGCIYVAVWKRIKGEKYISALTPFYFIHRRYKILLTCCEVKNRLLVQIKRFSSPSSVNSAFSLPFFNHTFSQGGFDSIRHPDSSSVQHRRCSQHRMDVKLK